MKKSSVTILALISCTLWASIFPVLKILYPLVNLSNGASSKMTLAGMRFFLAGILILLFYMITNKKLPLPQKKQWSSLALIGVFQTTMLYALIYISMSNVTGVKASVLSQSGIFIIIILAYLFLGERINKNQSLGILFGILGILVINVNQFSGETSLLDFSFKGEGLLLMSGLFGSIGQILAKVKSKGFNPLILNGWQMTFGGGILLTVGTIMNGGLIALTSPLAILLFLHTVLVASVGFTLWYTLLQHVEISSIVPFRLTIPIIGSTFSALLIADESLSFFILLGLGLVVFGMYISSRVTRQLLPEN